MKNKQFNSRRNFIRLASIAAGLFSLDQLPFPMRKDHLTKEALDVHIFSKHLQFLDHRTTGQIAKELGFSGVDLTVRPGGHVEPETVKKELPKAIEQITARGSQCKLITTAVKQANHPLDIDVLQTASENGVQFYRMDWYKYPSDQSMQEALAKYRDQIKALGELNKSLGLIGCYQNHAGKNVGASYWEVDQLLRTVDTEYFGVQYDIRHAMVEGGLSWENGLRLLHSYVKVIVLKDYKWEKVNGRWKVINTPIGKGMVDFVKYFTLLKKYGLKPPVSLHLEYDLGGAEKGSRSPSADWNVVFNAMKRDLDAIQLLWKKA